MPINAACAVRLVHPACSRITEALLSNAAVVSHRTNKPKLTTTFRDGQRAGEQFDLVASLEVIEHVEDPAGFVSSLAGLTRPGGMLTMSTINRTAKVGPKLLGVVSPELGSYFSALCRGAFIC